MLTSWKVFYHQLQPKLHPPTSTFCLSTSSTMDELREIGKCNDQSIKRTRPSSARAAWKYSRIISGIVTWSSLVDCFHIYIFLIRMNAGYVFIGQFCAQWHVQKQWFDLSWQTTKKHFLLHWHNLFFNVMHKGTPRHIYAYCTHKTVFTEKDILLTFTDNRTALLLLFFWTPNLSIARWRNSGRDSEQGGEKALRGGGDILYNIYIYHKILNVLICWQLIFRAWSTDGPGLLI